MGVRNSEDGVFALNSQATSHKTLTASDFGFLTPLIKLNQRTPKKQKTTLLRTSGGSIDQNSARGTPTAIDPILLEGTLRCNEGGHKEIISRGVGFGFCEVVAAESI